MRCEQPPSRRSPHIVGGLLWLFWLEGMRSSSAGRFVLTACSAGHHRNVLTDDPQWLRAVLGRNDEWLCGVATFGATGPTSGWRRAKAVAS
jgi:hypothetical protein